jgi:hypothetical protein
MSAKQWRMIRVESHVAAQLDALAAAQLAAYQSGHRDSLPGGVASMPSHSDVIADLIASRLAHQARGKRQQTKRRQGRAEPSADATAG